MISFQHRFAFENGNWDGGVIELSSDGGTSLDGHRCGRLQRHDQPGHDGSHRGQPARVRRIAGRAGPNFTGVTLNLGTAFASQDVRLRFRIGADESTGAPGWEIDDISIGGLTRSPFTAQLPETGVCQVAHHH